MILAGDAGGTNTRLALVAFEGKGLKVAALDIFPSRAYSDLDSIVRAFMKEHNAPVDRACIGVAGPVRQGRCETPNLAWVVDAHRLAAETGLPSVALINDLEANAYGISQLAPGDFAVLSEGKPDPEGNAALIAAGTGLGEAGLVRTGGRLRPFPSEGGHSDFAPRNRLEMDLLAYMLERYEHVSFERIVSGPGLANIYGFLRDTGCGEEPEWLRDRLSREDPAAVISEAALAGKSALCGKALDLFVSLYGAEAGNLALKIKATGGLFVGGGIAPKIIRKLQDSTFMTSFVAKGRMRHFLEAVPVRVILNDQTALLGAAHFAALGSTHAESKG
jgi:glucokinase